MLLICNTYLKDVKRIVGIVKNIKKEKICISLTEKDIIIANKT
jgi:hypothetical protein